MKIVQYFVIGLIVICFTGCSGEGGNEPLLPPFGGVAEVPIAWGVDAKTSSNRALVTNEKCIIMVPIGPINQWKLGLKEPIIVSVDSILIPIIPMHRPIG